MTKEESNDALDCLRVLLHREDSAGYHTVDYLAKTSTSKKRLRRLVASVDTTTAVLTRDGAFTDDDNDNWQMNVQARTMIAEWGYEVVDYFDLPREAVALALNYMDRVLQKSFLSKQGFQLLSITCLFMAIKLSTTKVLPAHLLVQLTKGQFDPEEICRMEQHVLQALDWYVHPPLALQFLHCYLDVLEQEVDKWGDWCRGNDTRHQIHERAIFVIENSVMDYFFIEQGQSPSIVAMAALYNVLSATFGHSPVPISSNSNGNHHHPLHVLSEHMLQLDPLKVEQCRCRLHSLMQCNKYYTKMPPIAAHPAPQPRITSPVSVIPGETTYITAANEDEKATP